MTDAALATLSTLEKSNALFIRYPRLEELHRKICRCQKASKLANEPECMALEGVTGAGKSTLVRDEYAAQFKSCMTPSGLIIPVLYVEMPSPATVKIAASAMLEAMGDPAAHHGTVGVLDSRLVNLIRECQVELVILDEFSNLIDTETDRVLAKVSDWLKMLIKRTRIPFLVVGIDGKVERILQANSQLSRLFAMRETLEPSARSSPTVTPRCSRPCSPARAEASSAPAIEERTQHHPAPSVTLASAPGHQWRRWQRDEPAALQRHSGGGEVQLYPGTADPGPSLQRAPGKTRWQGQPV